MKAIEEETGFWEPSTGSLYPLLDSLEKDGLIECVDDTNGKLWKITEQGERTFKESDEAKEELFQGMKRSLFVFANIFGERGMKELFKEIHHWREKDEENIRKKRKYLKIAHLVMHLEEFDQEERAKILEILDNALKKLEEVTSEVCLDETDN